MTATAILHARGCGGSGCVCVRSAEAGCGLTHCPAHDDRNPSLSVTEPEGKVLLKCFAGCTQDAVIEELRSRGLWEGGGYTSPRNALEPSNHLDRGLTIDQLAAAKRLPVSHLRHLGVREWHPSVGRTIVVIPHRGPAGEELAVHFRQ